MDSELVVRTFVIIKGFIDAKDERGSAIFGTLLALASRRELKYLSVMFSQDEPSKSMTWNDLLLLHSGRGDEQDGNPAMGRYENEINKILRSGSILNNVAKNHNTKQAEQSISRHCMEKLQLKAVSFIDYTEASDTDTAIFDLELKKAADPPPDEAGQDTPQSGSPETEEEDAEETDEPKAREDIAVRCEPILAPVGGIAMNELSIGDMVMVRLPEDSVFFKLLSRNVPGFDGVVGAKITGLLQNELGTATISLSLAEGITGVMKLSGKVRIKMAPSPDKKQETRAGIGDLPVNFIIFGVAGAMVVIAALAALYNLFFR